MVQRNNWLPELISNITGMGGTLKSFGAVITPFDPFIGRPCLLKVDELMQSVPGVFTPRCIVDGEVVQSTQRQRSDRGSTGGPGAPQVTCVSSL